MKGWEDRIEFKMRVHYFADKIKVDVKGIYIRPMKNKWASCSSNGILSFNDELLTMEKNLGDYVMVHELLHIHVPNHGKLWKSLMTAYIGDYEKLEQKLKTKSV
jgi:predicted metal-dependent hydrolase